MKNKVPEHLYMKPSDFITKKQYNKLKLNDWFLYYDDLANHIKRGQILSVSYSGNRLNTAQDTNKTIWAIHRYRIIKKLTRKTNPELWL